MVGRNQWKEMTHGRHSIGGSGGKWIFQEQEHSGKDLSLWIWWTCEACSRTGRQSSRVCQNSSTVQFRNALKFALEECLSLEVLRQERGWKLLTLIRMFLHRPPGGGLIPKSKLLGRFEAFSRGVFNVLFMSSEDCDKKAAVSRRRRHRTGGLDLERRALRPKTLIQMGELSSARQARADLAKGDRRPDRPRDPIPEELTAFEPMAMVRSG